MSDFNFCVTLRWIPLLYFDSQVVHESFFTLQWCDFFLQHFTNNSYTSQENNVLWPKILEVLSRLILETYCERYPYAMLLLNFFFSIFLLQNFKFTCCLGRFHHWITLNLIKYVLFGHTARTHACPAFLLWLDCDISVTWTFAWHAFFIFAIAYVWL